MEFSLHVEIDCREVDATQLGALAKLTKDYGGKWSMSPNGWLSVRYTTQAEVLRQANDAAYVLVPDWVHRAGLGWHTPIAVEAMSAVEAEQRHAQLIEGELIGIKEVSEITGKSVPRIKQVAAQDYGGFRVGRDWLFVRSVVVGVVERVARGEAD